MPIFDQGYQHWKGPLAGHAWRWLAITRQGLRTQLAGRAIRILLVLAWVPALALVVVLALWGLFEQGTESVLTLVRPLFPPGVAADPRAYRSAIWIIAYSTFFKFETFFIMLLVLVAGPNLISRDLRFNALALYFSRPLARHDYFLGKLGVIAALVAAVAVVPAAAAYVLGVGFSLDLGVIRDTWRLLPASLAYGTLMIVSAGTLMLALSSLSRRSLYVGIAWAGLWVVSSAVAGVLGNIHRAALYRVIIAEETGQAGLGSPPGQPPPPDVQKKYVPARPGRNPAWDRVRERVERAEIEAAPSNWRPLCSYTANLQRLGEALLGTDAAWVQIGRAVEAPRATLRPLFSIRGLFGRRPPPPQTNDRRLADQNVPQYPWIWSAGVLAGLLGLSLCILSTRVRSLDRLR
jgi:ABC-2 type transport system permease protein